MTVTIIVSVITAIITALITGLITFAIQERKLRFELRTEFMAEQAAKSLLSHDEWKMRSFEEIQKRLGGFDEKELRKILVRVVDTPVATLGGSFVLWAHD